MMGRDRTIKESWEAATGGWGADNRRGRRIDRKRRRRAAEREIDLALRHPSFDEPLAFCVGCGERYCDGC